MTNPYLELTAEFNAGRLRTLLSSGQAVVVHRLAVMSKDGDWIVREDAEALGHVLDVLRRHGAAYWLGAPLDARWLAGGWSSHFGALTGELRFVSRPPRIAPDRLARMWEDAAAAGTQVVGLEDLAAIKLMHVEMDYVVVGELARLMRDPRDRLRWSRSSQDLARLALLHPDLLADVVRERPLLSLVSQGRGALDEALDRERRRMMRANEVRLAGYRTAAEPWSAVWPDVLREIDGLPLADAHAVVVARAEGVLPFAPTDGGPDDDEARDEFLSEEDLDLKNMTWDEVVAYWNLWLHRAQATNDLDFDTYSHGVFDRDPAPRLL